MFKRNSKWLVALLAIILVVAGCSSQVDEFDDIEADLGVKIAIPQEFAQSSIEAITDDLTIDSIEATAINQSSGEKNRVETEDINDNVVVEFKSLATGEDYDIEVTANDGDYDIYQGERQVTSLESGSTVNLELDLLAATGLVVNFTDELTGEVELLNLADDLKADIEGNQAEFDELPANSYDIRINADGSESTGQIDVMPGRMTYSEDIELVDGDLGEIEVFHEEPPAAPEDFEASENEDGSIDLSWSGDEESYELYRSLDINNRELLTEVDGESYTDNDNIAEGTTYHYWVRAVNDDGVAGSFSHTEVTTTGESPGPEPDIENFNELRIYQVMVSSFQSGDRNIGYGEGYGPKNTEHKGDLIGIKEAIPYIADLGMNAIWMTPIFHSETGAKKMQSTGYYADNFFKVDRNFGTEADLRRLVKEANKHGIHVILDGVFGHTGGNVEDSRVITQGSQWEGKVVDYDNKSSSLEYFTDVATYWIEEYGIDGWRLDQAYQLTAYDDDDVVSGQYQDKNYWPYIREEVEKIANETDTLGYMVGENWLSEDEINDYGYEGNEGPNGTPALRSNLEFNVRYSLVQTLAQEEWSKVNDENRHLPASNLADGMDRINDIYPDFAKPNFFLTNHDLIRFGNLIEDAFGYGPEHDDYWKRHKAAHSFILAQTGPITLYYGDEIGDIGPGYYPKDNQSDNDYDAYWDNWARTDGRIDGFNEKEEDLHDYVQSLMELRDENPALWNGERENLIAEGGANADEGSRYADLKICPDTGDRMLYVLNVGTSNENFSFTENQLGGSQLEDALTGETVDISDIEVERLSARFFHVTD